MTDCNICAYCMYDITLMKLSTSLLPVTIQQFPRMYEIDLYIDYNSICHLNVVENYSICVLFLVQEEMEFLSYINGILRYFVQAQAVKVHLIL